ncbi:MAG: alkylation response protein AidB-like acyl-CoA dehydrogenase [Bacteroidia bacterium]|jgi:alkylation response protein AidB-like acyl-CoA dehydrogenase
MDFGLSEEQVLLQDQLRRLLSERAATDWLRETLADGPVHDDALWQALAEMGLTAVLVPEAHGGLGLGVLDAVLVQEALGAFAAPVSYTETAILAPLAITLAGTAAQQEQWLPSIADGSMQVAVGLGGAGGSRDGAAVGVVDGKLSGRLLFVLGAPEAALLICSSEAGDLYAVERDAKGMEWQALHSVDDSRCLWEVNFNGAAAQLLPGGDKDILPTLYAAGRIALAADTLGAGKNMLDLAVAYAAQRKQFNRLIGSFQAVKHMCAEMAAELEPARSLLWYSAHAFDHAPDERVLMACHVKAHLSEVGTMVARTATEVHGGMGFTDLLGLHYWFKRIGFNRQVLGSPERLRDEAAKVQGWI